MVNSKNTSFVVSRWAPILLTMVFRRKKTCQKLKLPYCRAPQCSNTHTSCLWISGNSPTPLILNLPLRIYWCCIDGACSLNPKPHEGGDWSPDCQPPRSPECSQQGIVENHITRIQRTTLYTGLQRHRLP